MRIIFGRAIDKRFYGDNGDDDNVIINFIFNRDRGVCNIGYLNWFIGFKLVCGCWWIARQTKHTHSSPRNIVIVQLAFIIMRLVGLAPYGIDVLSFIYFIVQGIIYFYIMFVYTTNPIGHLTRDKSKLDRKWLDRIEVLNQASDINVHILIHCIF